MSVYPARRSKLFMGSKGRLMTYRLLLLLTLLLVAVPGVAMADEPVPARDYTTVTQDDRYVFVMLAPEDIDFVERDEAIRDKYPATGLYRNGGPSDPLWTVDWYAFSVDVSSDGEHLVRWGPWPAKGEYDTLALAFYEDGRQMKSYSVNDLVARPGSLPRSVSHYEWLKESSFDGESNRLAIETSNEERYVFDVGSGELLSGSLPDWTDRVPLVGVVLTVVSATLVGILLAGGVLVVYIIRKQAR